MVCIDKFYNFLFLKIKIGYDVIYSFEDDNGCVVCDKVFEPLYLPETFNIFIQVFHLVGWSFLFDLFKFYSANNMSTVNFDSVQNISKPEIINTISNEMFYNLLNFRKLDAGQQVELFKNLYLTETFQRIAAKKYESFQGFLELISYFEENRLFEEQNKVITDMIVTVIEDYITSHTT
jgi:hypothetical protein